MRSAVRRGLLSFTFHNSTAFRVCDQKITGRYGECCLRRSVAQRPRHRATCLGLFMLRLTLDPSHGEPTSPCGTKSRCTTAAICRAGPSSRRIAISKLARLRGPGSRRGSAGRMLGDSRVPGRTVRDLRTGRAIGRPPCSSNEPRAHPGQARPPKKAVSYLAGSFAILIAL